MSWFTPGAAEAVWCAVNATFVTQLIALGVSATILGSIPLRLLKLGGSQYDVPKDPKTPEDVDPHDVQLAAATRYRRRRFWAWIIGIFAGFCCIGAFALWIVIYIQVDGGTKCSEIGV